MLFSPKGLSSHTPVWNKASWKEGGGNRPLNYQSGSRVRRSRKPLCASRGTGFKTPLTKMQGPQGCTSDHHRDQADSEMLSEKWPYVEKAEMRRVRIFNFFVCLFVFRSHEWRWNSILIAWRKSRLLISRPTGGGPG